MKPNIQKLRAEKPIKELLNFSLINIDKPSGPTSFQVSQFVKTALNLKKTSHMGTLDPKVTGVLPITLGRACRLSEYFMHRDKTYVGIMRLHEEIPKEELKEKMNSFIGKITQLPPVRSRVKRVARPRQIRQFKILEINGKDVLFEAEVEAGTYIRKLISDLGEKIGGAHMLELRRTKAGIFTEKNSINLYDFEKTIKNENELRKILIPAEILSEILPPIQANPESLKQILTGKPLHKNDVKEPLPDEEKFILFIEEKFIGVYRKTNEQNILARAEFVFN